jgi:hypothetical protein
MLRIISQVWEGDTMVPEQGGYFGKAFKASRGVKQVDIISPMIFNIVEDAVIRSSWNRGLEQQAHSFMLMMACYTGITIKDIQFAVDTLTEVLHK